MSCPTIFIEDVEFNVCDYVRVFVDIERQDGSRYWMQSNPMPVQEARERVRNWRQVGYAVQIERAEPLRS